MPLTSTALKGEASREVQEILAKAAEGNLEEKDALRLMKAEGIDDLFALFNTAHEIRKRQFGDKVFAYGFVYFSTYCRNNCSFCLYRRANRCAPRYRKKADEIMEIAEMLKKSGVHLIDLTSGEDPQIHSEKGYRRLLSYVERLKKELDMPLMVSPGVLPKTVLRELGRKGLDWYALYQETHNRLLFSKLRCRQDYDERMKAKTYAREEGMLIEEGILIGVGESREDVVDSVYQMKKMKAHQVRAMGFIPQRGTPMESRPSPPILEEMKAISLMRLVHPDRLIPASYDIDGLKGLGLRLMAGANVVTSLIPPRFHLRGVAQAELDVESSLRTLSGVKPYLQKLGLEVASLKSYRKWIEEEKARLPGK
ncbi:methylornithine synthase PylB [Candidatus Hecatella orcuttiae]|jgi:methylornithine synthase|uniref:methylornithine synthase PylB n=1 Tax=Candidatus Hecatella orcuttiae TaxID=1935119 RepID=UPI002867BCC1|nr:methylornithine synthase PylB [Candidatus Hecatella orcuttiae]